MSSVHVCVKKTKLLKIVEWMLFMCILWKTDCFLLFIYGLLTVFTMFRQYYQTGTWPTNERWKNPQRYLVWIAQSRELQLRYQIVCKQNINIDLNKWEEFAMDRFKWRSTYLQVTFKIVLLISFTLVLLYDCVYCIKIIN